jgi:hypothetical protein
MKIPTICFLLLIIGANAAAQANRVVGDSAKKIYWASGCSETWMIPMRSSINFPDATAAEKAGFTKADTCSTNVAPGVTYDSTPATIDTEKLRRLSASLMLIQDEISKYRNKTVRVVGNLSMSDRYLGEFGRMWNKYYAFSLSSLAGGTGYFYMAKNITSDSIREQIFDQEAKYADCQVRILGVASAYTIGESLSPHRGGSYLGGDLLNCRFWK